MADEREIISPGEILGKLSDALIGLSRSDLLVSLSSEIELRFQWVHTQLAAMEKATDLQHQDMVRVPTLLQTALASLKELLHQEALTHAAELRGELNKIYAEFAEKFLRVETQFTELDKRTGQLKVASEIAIAAAMAAAEKAGSKSENTVGESLKSLDSQLKTEIRATNDKVAALASRQDKNDGSNATLVSVGSGIVALMAIVVAGYSAFHAGNSSVSAPQPIVQYVPAPTAVPALVTVPR